MSKIEQLRAWIIIPILATLFVVGGCSGGGSGTDGIAGVGSGGTGQISGLAIKGPVGSATVTAYGITNGQMGAQIATATTAADGSFSMSIGNFAGPMMLHVSGGTYMDEATRKTMPLATGDVMTAVMPTVTAGTIMSGIQVTPVTGMAQSRALAMSGGMTDANITAANSAMGAYFGVSDILHIQPMNPLVAGSGAGASLDARNYGMIMAAMSQYASSLNMPYSSAVVTAMMNDAADGMMDGRQNGAQVSMGGMMGTGHMSPSAGTSDLATAMATFMGSSANMSGLSVTDMAVLMQRLMGSNGRF